MQKRRGSVAAACLAVAVVLLLVSCGKNRVPTEPGPIAGPRSTGPVAFVSDRDGSEAIYLANEDGSVVTRLTDGEMPAWSNDGQKIAFWRRDQNLYVINVDGSGLQRIVAGGWEPDWSPDGRLIVFRDQEFSISALDLIGSNRRTLHQSEHGPSVGPGWSPDGDRVVFSVQHYIDFFPALWTMNADGSDVKGMAIFSAWAPAWSPDGSQIAFISQAGLGLVSPDGSGERLQVAGAIVDVGWTPDGRLIYTRSDGRAVGGRIFITGGGGERRLIPETTAPRNAAYLDRQAAWRR